MNKKLGKLDNTMNQTILKNIKFTEEHKNGVYRRIDRKEKNRETVLFKKLFVQVLSVAVPVCFFFVFLHFNGIHLKALKENNESTTQVANNKNNNAVFTPEHNNEVYEDMTKEQILTKLLNTVDYFKTAKGSFEESRQSSGNKWEVHYQLLMDGKDSSGYSRVSFNNGEDEQATYFSKDKKWNIEEKKKTYTGGNYFSPEDYGEPLAIEEAFGNTTGSGATTTMYRGRPAIGRADSSLFPYEIASNYTRDLSKWQIEKQNEKLLNHNTLVIKGTLSDYAKSKFKSSTFRFWVDKDTGILMKYETYNDEGEIMNYLHTKELQINVPMNRKDMQPNLDGYKSLNKTVKKEIDPREEEIVDVAGTKSASEIKGVFQLMKKDMPFLYEFNHPDLKLVSASYESFREFKIGYLFYILDPEKDNNSQLLCVRVHHKDSYVRKIGDFERAGKVKIQPFKRNGIAWKGTILEDTSIKSVHFIGEKGDYVYDVVSQDITPEQTKGFLDHFQPIQ
ncbi:hypothetical protein [Niallia sp. 03133]|uniref:hypothetical protein n=1 Tax=Niallia sp. 03133 TaxID=3458060 RepID=UPI0040445AF4